MELKAFITGSSKGIGKAIALALADEGFEISINGRENKDVEQTQLEIFKKGVNCNILEGDMLDIINNLNEYIPLINMTYKEWIQSHDIIINCLGGGGTWKSEDAMKVMMKNYGITQKITREWLNKKRKWGRVITIASIYGTYSGHNPEFVAAKAAQIAFMKSLAGKYKGITFNCVSPSEVSDAGTPKKVELKSKDIANLIIFLCNDKAKFINGQNIVIGEYNAF